MYNLKISILYLICLSTVACSNNPQIRAIHAADLTPAADVYLNKKIILTNISYGGASPFSSSYSQPGLIELDIALTGTTIQSSAIKGTLPVKSLKSYSLLAIGEGTTGLTKLQGVVVEDNNLTPPIGIAKIRIIHAAANAGGVDIYVTLPGAPLLNPLVSNVKFSSVYPKSGESAFMASEGYYDIKITLHNPSASPGSVKVIFDSGKVFLKNGLDLLIIAVPSKKGSLPIDLLLVDHVGKTNFIHSI